MRNALGLMLASVMTALVITGVWFWTSSPRADAAPPQTIAARKAEPIYLYEDPHWTALGNRIVGEALAAELR